MVLPVKPLSNSGVGMAGPVWVLVIDRSARGVSVSVSAAVLLVATGSVVSAGKVMAAVLVSVPTAAGLVVAARV